VDKNFPLEIYLFLAQKLTLMVGGLQWLLTSLEQELSGNKKIKKRIIKECIVLSQNKLMATNVEKEMYKRM
jgi:hypothetical protein